MLFFFFPLGALPGVNGSALPFRRFRQRCFPSAPVSNRTACVPLQVFSFPPLSIPDFFRRAIDLYLRVVGFFPPSDPIYTVFFFFFFFLVFLFFLFFFFYFCFCWRDVILSSGRRPSASFIRSLTVPSHAPIQWIELTTPSLSPVSVGPTFFLPLLYSLVAFQPPSTQIAARAATPDSLAWPLFF